MWETSTTEPSKTLHTSQRVHIRTYTELSPPPAIGPRNQHNLRALIRMITVGRRCTGSSIATPFRCVLMIAGRVVRWRLWSWRCIHGPTRGTIPLGRCLSGTGASGARTGGAVPRISWGLMTTAPLWRPPGWRRRRLPGSARWMGRSTAAAALPGLSPWRRGLLRPRLRTGPGLWGSPGWT